MIDALPMPAVLAVFALAGLVVVIGGVRMTGLADVVADRTGLGEAVTGAALLGMATSLSGTVVAVTAALDGRASLAYSTGIGGIAAQTAFLALADLTYRRVNLEHASAEAASLFQAALLLLLMSIPLVAFAAPEVTLFGIHPASVVLVAVYLAGLEVMRRVREDPMWHPEETRDLRPDEPDDEAGGRRSNLSLGIEIALMIAAVGVAGWAIAQSGGRISDAYGISETAVGALMAAVVTSTPELVTTLAAVRRGALQLAVGGILGGNCFDMLFLSLSDAGYRGGSLYHAVGPGDLFWLAIGMVVTAVLLMGLIVRQRRGVGGIGFESAWILAIYAGAVMLQARLG